MNAENGVARAGIRRCAPLNASRTRAADSGCCTRRKLASSVRSGAITVLSNMRNRFHTSLMAILCPAPMTQNRDLDYWRAQAAEARAAAADMTDPKSKRTLERIATSYNILAKKAEEPKETARYLQQRGNKSN